MDEFSIVLGRQESINDQDFSINELLDLLMKHSEQTSKFIDSTLFTDVLHDLTSSSMNDLSYALDQSLTTRKYLQNKLECLAIEYYPVFLAKADTSDNVVDSISHITTANSALICQIPEFVQATRDFLPKTNSLLSCIKLGVKALDLHTQMVELLELPQLMDTSIHNEHFEDAIGILTYTRKLLRKHGTKVPIIKTISSQVNIVGLQLIQRLCNQLRSVLSLPVCIKVVVFLRRTEIFNEKELRLKFLQTRSTYLNQVLTTDVVNKPIAFGTFSRENLNVDGKFNVDNFGNVSGNQSQYDAFWRAIRIIESTRVHLFDIITQYRTVFLEEDTMWVPNLSSRLDVSLHPFATNPLCLCDDRRSTSTAVATNHTPFQSPQSYIFSSWLLHRIVLFLELLKADLQQLLKQPTWDLQHILDCLFLPIYPNPSTTTIDVAANCVTEADMHPENFFTRVQSLMSQTMYFGRSISRIGCDFRPHVVFIFNEAILEFNKIFLKNSINTFTVALVQLQWKTSDSNDCDIMDEDFPSSVLPPISKLCQHPPLVFLYNRIMELFNGLRVCCPVNLKDTLLHSLTVELTLAARRVTEIYRLLVDQHPVNWRTNAAQLADSFANILIPHVISTFLNQLFHQPDLRLGYAKTSLTSLVYTHRLGWLICKPMLEIWPLVPLRSVHNLDYLLPDETKMQSADGLVNGGHNATDEIQVCLFGHEGR